MTPKPPPPPSAIRQSAQQGCVTPFERANAAFYSREDITTCRRIAEHIATCTDDIRDSLADLNRNHAERYDPATARVLILEALDAYIGGDNQDLIRASLGVG